MSIERKTSDRRKLRAGMVFVLVVAGTALIGWGGLAAWQAVTQNNGSTASTLGVHMSNLATVSGGTGVTCNDQGTISPGPCGAIFAVAGITPGYSSTMPVGTVKITNTGTEASTFKLSESGTVSGGGNPLYQLSTDTTLCSNLMLTVNDSEIPPHQIYQGSLAAFTTANLSPQGGSLTGTWNPGESDTFTFNLSLPNSTPTDEDSTCTAVFTWTQNGV
jgi:hypothetical protein